MEITSFLNMFVEIFDDVSIESVSSETVFRDIEEWNSLSALSLIASVDDNWGVSLSGDDIRSCETVKDLFDIVNSRL